MTSAARSTENLISPAAVRRLPKPSIEAEVAPRRPDDVVSWSYVRSLSDRLRMAERERDALRSVLTSANVPLSAEGTRDLLTEMETGCSFERAESRSNAAEVHARGMLAPKGYARRRAR